MRPIFTQTLRNPLGVWHGCGIVGVRDAAFVIQMQRTITPFGIPPVFPAGLIGGGRDVGITKGRLMARARNIKPSFFTNPDLAELPDQAKLLFIGLWMLCDCQGKMLYDPRRIRAEIFPYDMHLDCTGLVRCLHGAGFVRLYSVEGKVYLWIPTFTKHQHTHIKEKPHGFPDYSDDCDIEPDKPGASPVQARCENVPLLNTEIPLLNTESSSGKVPRETFAPSVPPDDYAFHGLHFRIKRDQFHRWEESFKAIDVLLELKSLDEWYSKQLAKGDMTEKEIKTKWFWQVAQALAKKQLERTSSSGGASL